MSDLFDLQRFVAAQEPLIDRVLSELTAGRKRTHWMWFVFPQLKGLGRSAMAERYGISSLAEARAYLAHPVLGPRLRRCVGLANAIEGRTLGEIFGSPDDLKFRSCVTLFAQAAPECAELAEALEKHCGGEPDPRTVALLREAES